MIRSIPCGITAVEPGCVAAALRRAGPDHLLVHSPSSKPAGLRLGRARRVCVHGPASIEDIEDIERAQDGLARRGVTTIVALGTGSVIDTAKLLAARHDARLIAAPTVLSCNAFATGKSVVTASGARRSVDSREPDRILIDPVLLGAVPMRLHLFGLADALSIDTALHDWRLAIEADLEPYDAPMFELAESVLRHCLDTVGVFDAAVPAAARHAEIARILDASGYLTRLYGSGRPESGSEHMFARATELEPRGAGRRLWHGEAVLLGTLLTGRLQGREQSRILEIAGRLGLHRTIVDLGFTPVRVASLLHAAGRIRRDRYTIFNRLDLSPGDALDCAHAVLKTLEDASAPLRLAAAG